jgi:hypothetical protein
MGESVQRLRGRHTQAELARNAKAWGLPWTTGTVANVESGRAAPSLANIYLLVLALEDMLDRRVHPVELFEGSGVVKVAGREHELRLIRTLLSDRPIDRPKPDTSAVNAWMDHVEKTWPKWLQKVPYKRFHDTKAAMTEADLRIGKSLALVGEDGLVDEDRTAAVMAAKWGHPLSVERDRHAPPEANAQVRGRISRQLKEDLRKALADAGEGLMPAAGDWKLSDDWKLVVDGKVITDGDD